MVSQSEELEYQKAFATTDKVIAAYVKAKKEFKPVIKDGTNPHLKSKFASLNAYYEATNDALLKHGLVIIQDIVRMEGGIGVITTLHHESGQHIFAGPAFFPVVKNDPQGVGSTVTYGKRYCLAAFLQLAGEDEDDGVSASAKPSVYKGSGQRAAALSGGKVAASDF